MTTAASSATEHKAPSFDRRVLFACFGMLSGFLMGLLIWCFDFVFDGHYPVISTTLSLMAIEGMIGFLVAQRDKGRFDDLLSFIVAFFIVP